MAELVEALRLEGVSEEMIARLLNEVGIYWESQNVQAPLVVQAV